MSGLFKRIYKDDLEYLAEKIEDCGYTFTCKLTFTMDRGRFNNVFCEIKTSKGDVIGRYHPLFNNPLIIKKGYLDSSQALPGVIVALCKNYNLANSSVYDPESYNAYSFSKKLRYLYLEYQFSKRDNNISFLGYVNTPYNRMNFKVYCIRSEGGAYPHPFLRLSLGNSSLVESHLFA